jgi:citrate lyase subunit beta/citryl-CoA lyase
MSPRSYLLVPADRPEHVARALQAGADVVIVDLEAAVAPAAKGAARDALSRWLHGAEARPVTVRVNAAHTEAFTDDLRVCAHPAVTGVMVPEAESPDTLDAVAARLPGRALLALVETAEGLMAAQALARAAAITRLVFGCAELQDDLGIEGDDDALLLFRSQLVLASRLGGLDAPVDGVTVARDDLEAVARDTARARRLGFGGKLCLHPEQVAPVHAGFAPTADELAWARRVLAAAEASHGAAVYVDGRMADAQVVRRARRLVQRAAAR